MNYLGDKMRPHTLYVIEMIFKMIIALIVIAFIIHYLITEYKLNSYREELKKKVDTKERIKKMNKESNKKC
ncbi:MAG: hypothetical protein PUJ51_16485 [Clostridiales bacterium]|nr:hypothetical protein [Clostridiales bacterium]MDY4135287.1 hypothetical protein [Terrisporobacter sp.]